MPEGDTIFRTARTLDRAFSGKPVTAFRSVYPLLTRFDDETPIAGQLMTSIEPRGKWLLMHLSGGATLATHMLMNGSWHIYRHGERWQRPGDQMRLVLENSDYVAVGFTVPVAEIHPTKDVERILRIPPARVDVLGADFDPAEAARRIAARRDEEIANVMLNQQVLAGVGNVFKSEICFVTRTNPFSPVARLDAERIALIVGTSRKLVKANVLEDSGNTIVTYGGRRRRTTGATDPAANLWVYNRSGEPCRTCGTLIEKRMQGYAVRVTFWCPHCQPLS